jgi:hypothetical protein
VLSLDFVDHHGPLGRLARAHDRVAIRSRWAERQQLTGAQLVDPAATRALDDLRPLVLRNDPLHLNEQLVFWALAHRTLDEVHRDATLG